MGALRWLAAALRLGAAASRVAPRPPIPDRASSTIEERSNAFRRDTKWHLKYNVSFCDAAAAAPPPEAAGDVAWLVVCTPPSCAPDLPAIRALRARSRMPVVVLETLGGEATEMRGQSRSRKVRMLREYLNSAPGQRWRHVVYSDAMDVLANPGNAAAVVAAAAGGALVVAGEPACWVGDVCDAEEVAEMRRRAPAHFSRGGGYDRPAVFLNSGQYAGSRSAVLAFLDYAVATLDAMEARRGALPPDLAALFSGRRAALAAAGGFRCSDQCVLTAYWMTHVDRVAVDVDARIFGSLKRFFVLDDDDRGARAPNASRGGGAAAARAAVAWRAFDAAEWPPRSRYADAPAPPACGWLEAEAKAFAGGPGRFCGDYGAVAGEFAWACGGPGPPVLSFRGLAPLLGWHGNGHAPTHFFQSLLADLCYGRAACGG